MDGNLQDNRSWVQYWEEKANKNGEELKQLESTIKEGWFVLSGVVMCIFSQYNIMACMLIHSFGYKVNN